jgi:hypothetical protein
MEGSYVHRFTSYKPCKITTGVIDHYITNLIILIVLLKICWKYTFYLSYASTCMLPLYLIFLLSSGFIYFNWFNHYFLQFSFKLFQPRDRRQLLTGQGKRKRAIHA